jgi:hypothetical protein
MARSNPWGPSGHARVFLTPAASEEVYFFLWERHLAATLSWLEATPTEAGLHQPAFEAVGALRSHRQCGNRLLQELPAFSHSGAGGEGRLL